MFDRTKVRVTRLRSVGEKRRSPGRYVETDRGFLSEKGDGSGNRGLPNETGDRRDTLTRGLDCSMDLGAFRQGLMSAFGT